MSFLFAAIVTAAAAAAAANAAAAPAAPAAPAAVGAAAIVAGVRRVLNNVARSPQRRYRVLGPVRLHEDVVGIERREREDADICGG